MSAKIYTDEQIRVFHREYLKCKNLSVVAFAKKKGLKSSAVWCGFRRLGLEIIPLQITRQKFPINERFFEVIDTEEKAYMLGFLYADGCNHEEAHRLEVSLAKQDEDILVKFSKILLNGNVNVKEYKRNETREHRVGLYIVSQKISDDLKRHGCGARKTFTLKFPNLPVHLTQHFVRGYFDGDGMLVIYKRVMPRCVNETTTAEFSIVSTKEMLEEIGKIISSLGVNFRIKKRHKDRPNNNYTLLVSGNQQIKIVCDYLYKDATIFLNRKHDKYLQLVEMSKNFRKKYHNRRDHGYQEAG